MCMVESGWSCPLPGQACVVRRFVEAESGTVSSPMQRINDMTASGGQCVQVAAGNNSQNTPPATGRAVASFSVPVAGAYRVWGRVIAPTTSDDSFWVRVDAGAWVKWNDIFQRAGGTTWKWDSVRNSDMANAVVSYMLAPGSHTLEIAYREDGAKLDRLLVTNDLAFVPQ
jgi:hypothetical protein